MILRELAASAGLAVGLARASCGIAATCGTAAAGASTTAANVALAASRTAQLVSSQDRMFMDQASQINLTEISLGRYLHTHSTTTLAKNLGGIYARDHTAAQASLGALALRLHVTLPAKPGVQLESMVARVEAQKGRGRDVRLRQGLRQWPPDSHRHIQERRSAGSNPAVKAYAARYLPTLQTHLRLAKHAGVMADSPLAALDLPLKVLVWADGGQTNVTYYSPGELAAGTTSTLALPPAWPGSTRSDAVVAPPSQRPSEEGVHPGDVG